MGLELVKPLNLDNKLPIDHRFMIPEREEEALRRLTNWSVLPMTDGMGRMLDQGRVVKVGGRHLYAGWGKTAEDGRTIIQAEKLEHGLEGFAYLQNRVGDGARLGVLIPSKIEQRRMAANLQNWLHDTLFWHDVAASRFAPSHSLQMVSENWWDMVWGLVEERIGRLSQREAVVLVADRVPDGDWQELEFEPLTGLEGVGKRLRLELRSVVKTGRLSRRFDLQELLTGRKEKELTSGQQRILGLRRDL